MILADKTSDVTDDRSSELKQKSEYETKFLVKSEDINDEELDETEKDKKPSKVRRSKRKK